MEIEHLQRFSVTLTLVRVCRVARDARFRQSVDRNSFRSPCGRALSRSVQPVHQVQTLWELLYSNMRLVPWSWSRLRIYSAIPR